MTDLQDWIKIYNFLTGRRCFTFRQMITVAEVFGFEALIAFCRLADEHEQKHATMAMEYVRSKKRTHDPKLLVLDPKIDRTLGAIYRMAQEAVETLETGPMAEAAQRILDAVFSHGVGDVTRLNYYDQCARVENILVQLREKHAADVAALNATVYVDSLNTLNTEFSTILRQEERTDVTAQDVEESDRIGQQNLLRAIVMVLNAHPTDSEEDSTARERLLGPVMNQQRQIRSYIKRRRTVVDVDPENGVEIGGTPPTGSTPSNSPPPTTP